MNKNWEQIVNKAIDAGYSSNLYLLRNSEGNPHSLVCDPVFFQALGKACGWSKEYICEKCKKPISSYGDRREHDYSIKNHKWGTGFYLYDIENALHFHEINLTEGWDKAVEWLNELVK